MIFYEAIAGNWKFALRTEAAITLSLMAERVLAGEMRFSGENFTIQTKDAQPDRYVSLRQGNDFEGEADLDEDLPDKEKAAVLSVHGTLTLSGGMCAYGMADYGRILQRLDADSSVSAIILDIYSPGGTVDGTETLASIIAELETPVVAWVNSMACSAAYWLAAHCDLIVASGETAEVGSIGVLISYLDISQYLEKEGVKQRLIRSNLSPDKVKYNFFSPTEEDIEMIQEELLDPTARVFHARLATRRPQIAEEALTGNVYFAEQAKELGLIDSIGSLDFAIQKAFALARQGNSSQSQSNITMSTNPTPTAGAQPPAEVTALQQQLTDKQLANEALTTKLAALSAQVESMQARIAELETEPADDPHTPDAPRRTGLESVQDQFITAYDRQIRGI